MDIAGTTAATTTPLGPPHQATDPNAHLDLDQIWAITAGFNQDPAAWDHYVDCTHCKMQSAGFMD